MAVQSSTLVIRRNVRKTVGRLEGELAKDLQWFAPLWDVEELVSLRTQAPLGMLNAVLNGGPRVFVATLPIHRLKEEVFERQRRDLSWVEVILGEDELQFVATSLPKRTPCLGAYANPV